MNAGLLTALGIALAGGAGAAIRHLIDTGLPTLVRERFPWGIMLINLTGSFALGLLVGLAIDHPISSVLAVGLLGGYTTFSTASLDSVKMLAAKRYATALWNGPGMLVLATGLAVLGIAAGAAIARA